MDQESAERLRQAWNQQTIPVILRRGKGFSLRLRVPINSNDPLWVGKTRHWIKGTGRRIPEWHRDGKFWEVPQSWLDDLIHRLLNKYRQLYVIQPYREQEICARACWDAKGHECQCSCMGANHGQGKSGSWLEVSETFATKWGDQEVACRLLKAKPGQPIGA
jgi:hypothetical protein